MTIWAFNRDREIATLNDSKSSTTVLNALTASCTEVVRAAQAKESGSAVSEVTRPWSEAVTDVFDEISIVSDGLTFRLEDCVIKWAFSFIICFMTTKQPTAAWLTSDISGELKMSHGYSILTFPQSPKHEQQKDSKHTQNANNQV